MWQNLECGYGLYGDDATKRGTFFRLQVYEKVGNLLVEAERVGKSVISGFKTPKGKFMAVIESKKR